MGAQGAGRRKGDVSGDAAGLGGLPPREEGSGCQGAGPPPPPLCAVAGRRPACLPGAAAALLPGPRGPLPPGRGAVYLRQLRGVAPPPVPPT